TRELWPRPEIAVPPMRAASSAPTAMPIATPIPPTIWLKISTVRVRRCTRCIFGRASLACRRRATGPLSPLWFRVLHHVAAPTLQRHAPVGHFGLQLRNPPFRFRSVGDGEPAGVEFPYT